MLVSLGYRERLRELSSCAVERPLERWAGGPKQLAKPAHHRRHVTHEDVKIGVIDYMAAQYD